MLCFNIVQGKSDSSELTLDRLPLLWNDFLAPPHWHRQFNPKLDRRCFLPLQCSSHGGGFFGSIHHRLRLAYFQRFDVFESRLRLGWNVVGSRFPPRHSGPFFVTQIRRRIERTLQVQTLSKRGANPSSNHVYSAIHLSLL